MKWEILSEAKLDNGEDIINQLLKNRNIKGKQEVETFLNPSNPKDISIKDLGIKSPILKKVLKRIQEAKKKKEKVVVFGDYDADGVCATAILWEALYKLGFDAMPYIPDRFEDGYGIKAESFSNDKLMKLNPKLIITVDNGIVAKEGIKEAKKNGIDTIVVDHHQMSGVKIATEYILHSTEVCGSTLAWFLSKELGVDEGLDLAALGTVADQMPLLGINRSIVKYGLKKLKLTKRVGLQYLFNDSKIDNVGVYEVGYIVAPRINAMGRLASATDSLRFLCTRDPKKAKDLTKLLNDTNIERQKIVEDVVFRTLREVKVDDRVIVIDGKYHEGVIGLASGRVTEKYYKPSIVLSVGEKISKASARSIFGFNIIEAIKETGLILEGGGHPMAAGFSIETVKISEFRTKINEIGNRLLTDEILERKLKIDLEINFETINQDLLDRLKKFEPLGNGNYSPVFFTEKVKVLESKVVGHEGTHLKLKVSSGDKIFDAIAFGMGKDKKIKIKDEINIAFSIEENIWNGKSSIQLKIKDIK